MLTVPSQTNGSESAAPLHYRLSRADKIIASILFLGVVSLFLWPFVVFKVGPGEVGVLYRLFTTGTETTFVYHEGIGFKWPWNRIYLYNVRTQSRDYTVHALARDGLTVDVGTTVLFHPLIDKVGELHKRIGPDFADILIRPLTIAAVRDVIGKVSPHDIYKLNVDGLEQQVQQRLQGGPNELINYQDVTIRDVRLPAMLNKAITKKLAEQQHAETYKYILLREKKEAERKRIEAVGIQTFYSIVANALSPQLLTWRGIEATVELARSNNAKVVIVGGGKDQLPLILGSDIAQQPNLPNPPAVNPEQHELPNLDKLPNLFPNISARPPPIERSDAKRPWASVLANPGQLPKASVNGRKD